MRPFHDLQLTALIGAADAAAREVEIERLIVTLTQPLAERILRRYSLQRPDAEDLISTVNLAVIRKLRQACEPGGEPIARLEDYVATLTYNAMHDHLRRRYPERTRLKNRLRYLLTHDARLALWTAGGETAAGLAAWKGSAPSAAAAVPQRRTASRRMLDRERQAEALVEIFRFAGAPLRLETLLEVAAELWEVADAPQAAMEPAARVEDVPARLEQAEFLQALWREIRLLPPRQRIALLLNLREAEAASPIALLLLTGTTSFEEIAATMEMTPEALVGLWNDLPLEDSRIAGMLGLTRQQVINLRKAARLRLERHLFRGSR